jgi:hypothetical protein
VAVSPPGSDPRAGEPSSSSTRGGEGADSRALIALGILEAVEACGRASEMVERLDGAYIHDDDWDEEQFVLEP